MKKQDKILKAISENKDLQKNFKKLYSFTNEEFLNNAKRYIKAVKDGRMFCVIESVSASGMSRVLDFKEMNGNKKEGFRIYNFNALFVALGFQSVKNSGFRVNGCGMDMVFHTNYTIIHNLKNLGLISKDECNILAQKTPSVV